MLRTHAPSSPEPPKTPFQPRKFLCSIPLLYQIPTCPKAQTLLAHDVDWDENLVLVLPCKQWTCRYCAARKVASLAFRTKMADPNRLLTLTINPALYETPREAFDATRRKIPTLFSKLRLRFDSIEYLRVTEVTRLGWPHYHCLIRSPYLPHPVVRDAWATLTGATIVDLRQVNKRFKVYIYLLKYLTKMHHLDWTERHVSYSKDFFPPTEPGKNFKRNLKQLFIVPMHPYNYLRTHYEGRTICQTTPGTFRVDIEPPVPAGAFPHSAENLAAFFRDTAMAKQDSES